MWSPPTCTSTSSVLSPGLLQFDLWGAEPKSGQNFNWPELKAKIAEKGLRTSWARLGSGRKIWGFPWRHGMPLGSPASVFGTKIMEHFPLKYA